ncbi:MAG: thiamine pyrophosphate-binding protein [Spirochaetales bacterium]|nr:thiamine pyrophosphate-binding protein [Spirochaetales bacterium]
MSESWNAGSVVARILKQEGVEKIFGIIDGTYFGFYSSAVKEGMQLITPRHETSAAHMAGAYARLTGKLGVCMASNGPGVANILPGLVVEEGEGNRLLLITSARRTGIMYPDRGGTYQCFDQVAVIAKIAKYSVAVPSFERTAEIMRSALRHCYSGRPGVVHVDIPENIMNTKVKASPDLRHPERYRVMEPLTPSTDQVRRAADMLCAAKLPMIHAGSGVLHSGASLLLEEVADLLHAPVTTSWAARGALRETHELAIPMVDVTLNHRVRNAADLVLVLGSRLGETDWWGKAPYWKHPAGQQMIQVDTDAFILGANKPVDLAIQADVKVLLSLLALELRSRSLDQNHRRKEMQQFSKYRQAYRARLDRALQKESQLVHPARAVMACRETLGDETILVADGGNTAIWANFYWQVRTAGTVLSTFKFGMLGAGVAQALGAAVARPGKQVCCIIGDGAMGFHPQEIETAVRHGLKVLYVVLCDRQWGMVKMNQSFTLRPWKMLLYKRLDPGETIAADLGEIRFDLVARAMGAYGERVQTNSELLPALERCIQSGLPAVLHVDVDPVAHMWAPGLRHFKDMHLEPGRR